MTSHHQEDPHPPDGPHARQMGGGESGGLVAAAAAAAARALAAAAAATAACRCCCWRVLVVMDVVELLDCEGVHRATTAFPSIFLTYIHIIHMILLVTAGQHTSPSIGSSSLFLFM